MSGSGRKINFYPNDPSAEEVPLMQASFEVSDLPQKWTVEGGPVEVGLYEPSNPDFQACHLNLAFFRCTNLWNKLFQGGFDSWNNTENLVIRPRIDYRIFNLPGQEPEFNDGFNAFYTRSINGTETSSINFLYERDAIRNKLVYTCESCDISFHEEGHAVLDAVMPELTDFPVTEGDAFHEAFGDCSSILCTLLDDNVRKAFLRIDDPLHESNLVSRLAEEMGHGIYSKYGKDASSPEYLRDAINDFKYTNPDSLPNSGPNSILTRRGHSFSRIFIGGFYRSLVRIYQFLREEIQDSDRALRQAGDHLGAILGNAILATTVNPNFFREVALSMLKADELLFEGKYRQAIGESFVEKGILSSAESGKIPLQSATGSAKAIADIELPKEMSKLRSEALVKDIGERIGMVDPQLIEPWVKKSPDSNSLVICGLQNNFRKLTVDDQGHPDEITAYVPSGFSIVADMKSGATISHTYISDDNTINEVQSYLRYLLSMNKIYTLEDRKKLGNVNDMMKLVILHKSWYISEDSKLLRAYLP
jgi:hypothetical protein